MPTSVLVGGGGTLRLSGDKEFPSGYAFKSTYMGNTFPGFGSNVIPLTMQISLSTGSYGSSHMGTSCGSEGHTNKTINGTVAAKIDLYGNSRCDNPTAVWGGRRIYNSASGSGVDIVEFLPPFFNFDWDALQVGITSGTITSWLEKE